MQQLRNSYSLTDLRERDQEPERQDRFTDVTEEQGELIAKLDVEVSLIKFKT